MAPSAVCILLGSSPERCEHVKNAVVPRYPEVRVLDAFDGDDDDASRAAAAFLWGGKPQPAEVNTPYARRFTACKASHAKAWADFLGREEDRFLLVLEDDALVQEGAPEAAADACAELPDGPPAICYVTAAKAFPALGAVTDTEFRHIWRSRPTWPFVAYIVNRAAARLLLDAARSTRFAEIQIDLLAVELCNAGLIRSFRCKREFVRNGGQETEDDPGGMRSNIYRNRAH